MGYRQRSLPFCFISLCSCFPISIWTKWSISHNLFLKLFRNSFLWKKLSVGGRASPQWCCRLCIVTFQSGTFLFKMNSVGAIFSKDVFRQLFYSGHHHMWHTCISTISWYAIIPDIIIIINVINVIVTVNTHLTVIKVKITNNKYMFSATEFHHYHNCH